MPRKHAMRDPERHLANEIREQVRAQRARLTSDPDGDPLIWPIPGSLALAQRPLRDHREHGRSGAPVPKHAGPLVVSWVRRVRNLGIQSIICLMHPKELAYYNGLEEMPEGLFRAYESAGFAISHIPWADPAHEPTPEAKERVRNQIHEIKLDAYSAYHSLRKPVVLQCSAGIDRSSPVAAYIVLHERHESGA